MAASKKEKADLLNSLLDAFNWFISLLIAVIEKYNQSLFDAPP